MHQRAVGHVEHVVAAGAAEADGAVVADGELRNSAIAPGVGAVGHADGRLHRRVGKMTDAREELADDARLPVELRGIGEVLPLEAAGLAQLRVAWLDTVGRGTQHFDKGGARIVAALAGEAGAHELTRQAAGDEDGAALVAADGIAAIGEVGQLQLDQWPVGRRPIRGGQRSVHAWALVEWTAGGGGPGHTAVTVGHRSLFTTTWLPRVPAWRTHIPSVVCGNCNTLLTTCARREAHTSRS